ncbi:MAG: amidohydrolase [Rhizobacter sp.]|nr:amidohydrolase [Rhizobacter sp.]
MEPAEHDPIDTERLAQLSRQGMLRRRRWALGVAAVLAAGGAGLAGLNRRFLNPCASAADAGHRVDPDLLASVWQGLAPARVWDCHVHLAGVGAAPGDDSPWTNPRLRNPANPFLFAHFALYADASCVLDSPGRANLAYVERLGQLTSEFPDGAKFMLFAMDGCYRPDGKLDTERSPMWVPNGYAMRIARQDRDRFEWVASINPARPDALELLRDAARQGAVALKWVPYFMDIDPGSAEFNAFYDLLASLRLPLIVHAGWQHELVRGSAQEHGNPLRLRRALERGVRVVVAHCATQGDFADTDPGGGNTQRSSFELFARMIDEPAHRGLLMGEISGIVDTGRPKEMLRELLTHPRWRGRLLNGSDYPLPGVPVAVSTRHLIEGGLLDRRLAPLIDHIQAHNPLLFDLVLKRSLEWQGVRFAPEVFETAGYFRREAVGPAAPR